MKYLRNGFLIEACSDKYSSKERSYDFLLIHVKLIHSIVHPVYYVQIKTNFIVVKFTERD